jgi:hypothetical protein
MYGLTTQDSVDYAEATRQPAVAAASTSAFDDYSSNDYPCDWPEDSKHKAGRHCPRFNAYFETFEAFARKCRHRDPKTDKASIQRWWLYLWTPEAQQDHIRMRVSA